MEIKGINLRRVPHTQILNEYWLLILLIEDKFSHIRENKKPHFCEHSCENKRNHIFEALEFSHNFSKKEEFIDTQFYKKTIV